MSSNNPVGIVKRSNSYFADPAFIVRRAGWNPRFDFGDLSELEQSILSNGFRPEKPLLVRRNEDKKLEIVDGDRRFTAVERLIKAGWSELFADGIPVVIEDKEEANDVTSLILAITANQGKPLLPLEEAGAFKRLMDSGMKVGDLAKAVGKSLANVKWTLGLLEADDSVKTAVKEGKLSGSLAKDIAMKAKGNKGKQKELVEKATSGKKGAKKAAKIEVQEIKRRPTKKSSQQEIATPKLKMINIEKVQELEVKVIAQMAEVVKALGLQEDTIRPFVQGSDETTAAYYFGVLLGLRYATGYDIPVIL